MRFIDETKNIYGRLKPVKRIKTQGKTFWECLCTCGNIKIVAQGNLKNGGVKSCGCYRLEKFRKYFIDSSQFVTITTPEVAYILGLFWADGHIRKPNKKSTHTISLEVSTDDMKDFLPTLFSVGTWAISERKRDRSGNKRFSSMTSVRISDKKLWGVFVSDGFAEKSRLSAIKVLDRIPSELHPYFFRGYFDGDGGIQLKHKNYPSISFSGGFEQDLSFLYSLLSQLDINYNTIIQKTRVNGREHRGKAVYFHGRANAHIFYSYLYKNKKEFGLKRKFKSFQKSLEPIKDDRVKLIRYKDKTQSITEWSRELRLDRTTIRKRLKLGVPLEKRFI